MAGTCPERQAEMGARRMIKTGDQRGCRPGGQRRDRYPVLRIAAVGQFWPTARPVVTFGPQPAARTGVSRCGIP
jgi:hypothetical protein